MWAGLFSSIMQRSVSFLSICGYACLWLNLIIHRKFITNLFHLVFRTGTEGSESECNCVSIFLQSWWRHQIEPFSVLLALCTGIHWSPVNSPHKGQWRGSLMFSLICVWTNGWANNRDAGDLRRHRVHYGVIVIFLFNKLCIQWFSMHLKF